ncbi:MAG: VPDSG-CTERM sorting domain-containing protein [Limisphaera sp.]|nr:VPDSG-CTERM sorting domain-containing protein [Limisphaera sp.]
MKTRTPAPQRRRTGIGILLGALLCTAAATQALPIRLDTSPYIVPTTSVPGNPANQGNGTVQQWLQDLVDEYNAANNPDLPAVANSPAVAVTTPGSPTSLTINVLGYLYLTAHWGQGQTPDHTQAWYLGGTTTSFTLTAPGQNGLSGYRLWNPVRVPDGGGTLALLGIGLLALAGYARHRRL